MKKALIILTSFTLILLFWGCAATAPTEDGPDFYNVDVSVRDTTARTDVFIHVPYEELVFEVVNNRERQAKWDIEGALYYNGVLKSSASGSQIETIPYDSRDDQSTKIISIYRLSFWGTPGRYQLRVIATDRSTGKSQTRTYDISLRPILTNSFNVSDPVFLGDAVRGSDRKAAAFLDPQNLDHQKPLAFAFELYVPDAPRNVTALVHYKVMASAGQDVLLAYTDTLHNVEVPREGKKLITIVRTIPDTLSSGKYVFEFYVTEPATGAMSDIIRKEIGFFGDWPNSPEEMKMAFKALEYLDEQAAVEIEGAKTKREKIDLFYKALATSSRLRNRGVDKREFISRLNYVNKTFSSFKKIDGWKSPRGRIYIKFGMPDNVFLFPITTWRMYNYEVWYYSPRPASGDRERLFVFVEKDGEYKLDYFPKFPEFGRFPKIPLNMEF